MSKLISIDSEYMERLQDVSHRFKSSQIKAAVKVNDEMLRFYWSPGKDISEKSMVSKYGTAVLSQTYSAVTYSTLAADCLIIHKEAI